MFQVLEVKSFEYSVICKNIMSTTTPFNPSVPSFEINKSSVIKQGDSVGNAACNLLRLNRIIAQN